MDGTGVSAGDGDGDGDGDGNGDWDEAYSHLCDISLGETIVTDEHTGQRYVQFKATSGEGAQQVEAVSDDPMAAVLSVLDETINYDI